MSKLKMLLNILETHEDKDKVYNYVVPDLWNCFNYNGEEVKQTKWGELMVNPYKFYSFLIKDYILAEKKDSKKYDRPLSKIKNINKIKKIEYVIVSGLSWGLFAIIVFAVLKLQEGGLIFFGIFFFLSGAVFSYFYYYKSSINISIFSMTFNKCTSWRYLIAH